MEYQTLVFWSCILAVACVAFGKATVGKLSYLNKKYHIVSFCNQSIYANDEDD